MNRMETEITSPRGVILEDNVDLEWLKACTPKYHSDYIKFVVNTANNKVAVGMDIHRDAETLLGGDLEYLYGGNIFWDGHIVYESTLNVDKNLKSKWFKKNRGNPRTITDPEIIQMINSILLSWIQI